LGEAVGGGIRGEQCQELWSSPKDFLQTVYEGLQDKQTGAEAAKVFTLLLRPEPLGCRGRVVHALADCYFREAELIKRTFQLYESFDPEASEELAYEVCRTAFDKLRATPATFVAWAYYDLGDEERRQVISNLLLHMAQPAPSGQRDELVHVLLQAYELEPDEASKLLNLFRRTKNKALNFVAYWVRRKVLVRLLGAPSELLQELSRVRSRPKEWEATLEILQQLARPGGEEREGLIRALASATAIDSSQVGELLFDPALRSMQHLSRLWLHVKLRSWFS